MTNHTGSSSTKTIEFTYADEYSAHVARRNAINAGRTVSLVAFDPTRDLYAFDVITNA